MDQLYQPYTSYKFSETDWYTRVKRLLDLQNVTAVETILPFGINWSFSSSFSLNNPLQSGLQNVFISNFQNSIARIKENIYEKNRGDLDLRIYNDCIKPLDSDIFPVFNSRLKVLINFGTDLCPSSSRLSISLPTTRFTDLTLIHTWTDLPLLLTRTDRFLLLEVLINITSRPHILHEYTNKFLTAAYKIAATECLCPEFRMVKDANNYQETLVLNWV